MSSLTRDGTAEPVSRDQILRHARGQGNIHFPCSADHEQDWQLYPVDPYSAICDDHTYIHTYIHTTNGLLVFFFIQLVRYDSLQTQFLCGSIVKTEIESDTVACVECVTCLELLGKNDVKGSFVTVCMYGHHIHIARV